MNADISGSQNQDFRTISRKLPKNAECFVLDMGCGNGLYSSEIATGGTRVFGIDLLKESLLIARKNEPSKCVSWICADIRHLPFRNEVFGLILSVEVLTHLPLKERREVFFEMARVGKEGANVYLTLHNRRRLDFRAWLLRQDIREVYETNNLPVWPTNEVSMQKLAKDCGFTISAPIVYLNYYSRFSTDFVCRFPILSKGLALFEDLISKVPVIRRLSITLYLQLKKLR